jgi:hypothetical protein
MFKLLKIELIKVKRKTHVIYMLVVGLILLLIGLTFFIAQVISSRSPCVEPTAVTPHSLLILC